MLFSVFYVGDSCQGWGREFESRFPLQIQKSPSQMIRAFFMAKNLNLNNPSIFIQVARQFFTKLICLNLPAIF